MHMRLWQKIMVCDNWRKPPIPHVPSWCKLQRYLGHGAETGSGQNPMGWVLLQCPRKETR